MGNPGAGDHQRAPLALGVEAITGQFTLDVTYARAKAKMWEQGRAADEAAASCSISDFGTRRRHSFLWQRWCVEALKEGLGEQFFRHLQRASRDGKRSSKRSAPTPMNCRWCLPRSRPRKRRSKLRPTRCSRTGRVLLWRQSADRSARRLRHRMRSCATRPTGWLTGPGSVRTPPPPSRAVKSIIAWWQSAWPGSA